MRVCRRFRQPKLPSRFNLSVKFCDFSEASLLSLDSDMKSVGDNGYTTRIDIGLLGAVMYEIITGDKCEIDLYKDNSPTDGRAYWPRIELLPSTQGVWLSFILEDCWNGKFSSAQSLLQALEPVESPFSTSISRPLLTRALVSVKDSITERPIITVIGVLTLVMCGLIIGRKEF